MKFRELIVVSFLALSGLGSSVYFNRSCSQPDFDSADAIEATRAFASKLGVEFNMAEATTRRSTSGGVAKWEVVWGNSKVFVQERTGKVSTYFLRQVPSSAPPINFSLAEAELKARAIRQRFGVDHWPLYQNVERNSMLGTSFSIEYFEAIAGESTYPFGNGLKVSIHKKSGLVIFASIQAGARYAPKDVQITSAQARSNAAALIQQYEPRWVSEFVAVKAGYVMAADRFGSGSYEVDRRDNLLRYCYTVMFRKAAVYIDAKTGESRGGVIMR